MEHGTSKYTVIMVNALYVQISGLALTLKRCVVLGFFEP